LLKKKLIIVENLPDLINFLDNQIKINFKEIIFLTFKPDIKLFIESKGFETVNNNKYSKIIFHKKSMKNIVKIEKFYNSFYVKNKLQKPPDWLLNSFIFYFRYLYYHSSWYINFFNEIFKDYEFTELIAFKKDKSSFRSPWVKSEDRYFTEIIKQFSLKYKIKFRYLILDNSNKQKKININFIQELNYKIIDKILLLIKKNSKKIILVSNFSRNMNLLCNEIRYESKNIIFFSLNWDPNFKSNFRDLLKNLYIFIKNYSYLLFKKDFLKKNSLLPDHIIYPLSLTGNKCLEKYDKHNFFDNIAYFKKFIDSIKNKNTNIFILNNINFFDILFSKVKLDLFSYLNNNIIDSRNLYYGLKKIQPNFVISQMNLGVFGALGHYTKLMNIPSLLISHGSHVYNSNKFIFSEQKVIANNILVGSYKYHGFQSPSAKNFAKKILKSQKGFLNIKPTMWGNNVIKKNIHKKNSITIVHASTFKIGSTRFMFESSFEYLQTLIEICNIVKKYQNLKLIIKFRNTPGLSIKTLISYLPELSKNISIDTKSSFQNILENTDLLISYSSTTIEESLVNNIPVLQYGGGGRYKHFPVKNFKNTDDVKKPIIFVNNRYYLEKYLKKISGLGYQKYKISNNKFDKYRFLRKKQIIINKWIKDRL
tara:strand:- start:34723 stop:36672 length:1950 start_codon:yes stop_codon:yes gene_type:complete